MMTNSVARRPGSGNIGVLRDIKRACAAFDPASKKRCNNTALEGLFCKEHNKDSQKTPTPNVVLVKLDLPFGYYNRFETAGVPRAIVGPFQGRDSGILVVREYIPNAGASCLVEELVSKDFVLRDGKLLGPEKERLLLVFSTTEIPNYKPQLENERSFPWNICDELMSHGFLKTFIWDNAPRNEGLYPGMRVITINFTSPLPSRRKPIFTVLYNEGLFGIKAVPA